MAWLAHTTAALGRVKRFPDLRKLLPAEDRRQTPEEMQAALQDVFAARKRALRG